MRVCKKNLIIIAASIVAVIAIAVGCIIAFGGQEHVCVYTDNCDTTCDECGETLEFTFDDEDEDEEETSQEEGDDDDNPKMVDDKKAKSEKIYYSIN